MTFNSGIPELDAAGWLPFMSESSPKDPNMSEIEPRSMHPIKLYCTMFLKKL